MREARPEPGLDVLVVGLLTLELGGELTAVMVPRGSGLPEPWSEGQTRPDARLLNLVLSLPVDVQTLLLIAAAEPSGDPALLRRAATCLGVDVPATTELDALLTLQPRVAFRDPAMGAAVYGGASPLARQRVHRALAAAKSPWTVRQPLFPATGADKRSEVRRVMPHAVR